MLSRPAVGIVFKVKDKERSEKKEGVSSHGAMVPLPQVLTATSRDWQGCVGRGID